jgi:Domain of unknown function (DUF4395)
MDAALRGPVRRGKRCAPSGVVQGVFRFPNPVNELVARTVACTVLVLCVAAAVTQNEWLFAVIAAGFVLRVTTASRIDPVAVVASRLVAPRLGPPRWTPGPPKRFAQGIGATLTVPAALLAVLGTTAPAVALVAIVAVAAFLEGVVGFCVGCWLFARLMRAGVIPEHVCVECADLRGRLA